MGFDGKTLIHPEPDRTVQRRIFAPSAEEVAWAKKIIAAFDFAGERRTRASCALDGRMVERLHADMARRTVAIAEAIAAAEAAGRPPAERAAAKS